MKAAPMTTQFTKEQKASLVEITSLLTLIVYKLDDWNVDDFKQISKLSNRLKHEIVRSQKGNIAMLWKADEEFMKVALDYHDALIKEIAPLSLADKVKYTGLCRAMKEGAIRIED